MANEQKNWRNLDPHPVDEWDHWTNTRTQYERLKAQWDAHGIDDLPKEALAFFAKLVRDYEACEQAEMQAGPDI